ncbi:MAG TPA: ABC transporter permease [Thermoanaerobaculia bacterium]|nr:ABC transporter permease [Thermoanaerobaculia bacterium]
MRVPNTLTPSLRGLLRSPGFTVAVVASLAIGIGANVALFSVYESIVLRRLPYPDAERLVVVWTDLSKRGIENYPSSPADLEDYRRVEAFAGVAGATTFATTLIGDGGPERVEAAAVTWNLFDVLGIGTVHGRGFEPRDGAFSQGEGEQPETSVLLSHALWQRRYGGDPDVVDRLIDLSGQSARVVGVLPPGVQLLANPRAGIAPRTELFTAGRFDPGFRGNFFLYTIARLRPGVSLRAAQAEIDALGEWRREQFGNYAAAGSTLRLVPMHDDLSASSRAGLAALFGAVAFVLLIASLNVSNLLMVRNSSRRHELSLRAALGAGSRRLLGQLLGESLLLAALGGAAGLAIATAALETLRRAGPLDLPRLREVSINPIVLAFALGLCLVATVLFGVVPAWRGARVDPMGVLRAGARGGPTRGEGRWRHAVVIAEVALSMVLLIGAGLMVRSLWELQRSELGFDPRRVVTFETPIPFGEYDTPEKRSALIRQLETGFDAIPGVLATGAAASLPLAGRSAQSPFGSVADLADGDESDLRQANVRIVRPGYFAALDTRLLAGRDLDHVDEQRAIERLEELWEGDPPAEAGPPVAVGEVIVDRDLAEQAWPDENPIGQLLYVKVRVPGIWVRVAGVVETQAQASLIGDRPSIYFHDGFLGVMATPRWALRTELDPGVLAAVARDVLAEIDPDIPLADLAPMTELIDGALAPHRFSLRLMGAFAIVALILATVGLYGVLSHVVRTRLRELGIRMAFGASASAIARSITARGLLLAAVGVALGLAGALLFTRFLASQLVNVSATDPGTFASIAALELLVAAAASLVPARRAARLDLVSLLAEE